MPNHLLQPVALQVVLQNDRVDEPGAGDLHGLVVSHVPALLEDLELDPVVRGVVYDLDVALAKARLHLAEPPQPLRGHGHRSQILEVVAVVVGLHRRVLLPQLLSDLVVTDQEVGDLLRHDERRYAEPREPQEHHQQG